jgi:hypothetical protein
MLHVIKNLYIKKIKMKKIILGMSALIILGIHNIFQDRKYAIEFRQYLNEVKSEPEDILSDELFVYESLQTQKIVTIEPGGSLCRSLDMTESEAMEFAKTYNLEMIPRNRVVEPLVRPGDQFISVFIPSLGKHTWFPRVNNLCLDVD